MRIWASILIFLLFLYIDVDAQCVMCKATAESAADAGDRTIEGLNSGILFLMGIPYAIMLVVGYIFYKNRNK